MGVRVVVTDANILINLMRIGRLDLLGQLGGFEFVVPPEVAAEIVDPEQASALEGAFAAAWIHPESLTEIEGLALYSELVAIMGKGEAACLSLAVTQGWMIASDERRVFRREVLARLGANRLLNTPGILLLAIKQGLLSVEEGDATLQVLAGQRFRVKFKSFRDLLEEES
jgi:predicted nucleic acid-binding protein